MRITNMMLTNNFTRSMQSNLRQLQIYQNRLVSQREVWRPSDDPVRVVNSLALRSDLGETNQYTTNVSDARTWLEISEGALGDATQVFHRVKELAVAGASDTLSQESRDAIALEIDQLRDQLGLIANTTHGGRYIFGGTRTNQPPYNRTDGSWQGNEQEIIYEIAPGVTMPVNCNGKAVFTGDGVTNPDAFQVLQDLADHLRNGESDIISSTVLSQIDQVTDNLIASRGELGARVNRTEMVVDRLMQTEVMQTELLSLAEDTDIARAIMDLKNQENIYRVTLAAGSRMIMPTLIDFLR